MFPGFGNLNYFVVVSEDSLSQGLFHLLLDDLKKNCEFILITQVLRILEVLT